MKILSLNVWEGGRLRPEISQFLNTNISDIDILCLQEAYESFHEVIEPFLESFVEVKGNNVITSDDFWQATLVRKSLIVREWGTLLEDEPEMGFCVWTHIEKDDQPYYILNYHGKSQPGTKLDNAERILASQKLIDFTKNQPGHHIVVGDFNLLETTKSVSVFEESGFSNLIKEFHIETTRNRHSWDLYPNDPQLHSDYAFVSPGVRVIDFKVLPDIVSDHQPLLLEVE